MSSQPTATDLQLLEAVSNGDHRLVVQLLDKGASPNAVHGPELVTALHHAAVQGSRDVVRELLQRGADPDARTNRGRTPLHAAATMGQMDSAAALIRGGASVNAQDHIGFTPLHSAAAVGYLSIMKLLLDNGCGINAAGTNGVTPLIVASRMGMRHAVLLLVARGAAVGAACEEGNTALHHAILEGHLEVAAVLLNAKAPVTAVNNKGNTPLFVASSRGHELMVRLLLSRGANPYTPGSSGFLPLHIACAGNHKGVVTRLLRGRRTPAHLNAVALQGFTPLHMATSGGHAELVALLLKAGADVNARSDDQRTPLHLAIKDGEDLILQQLLAAGADPAVLLDSGANGLHVAVAFGHSTTLQVLLPAIAAVAGRGVVDAEHQGMSPLHCAVVLGHTACVEVLLAAGADPDKLYMLADAAAEQGSLAGVSALYRAVQLRRTAMVPLLATPSNMRSCWEGQTPLHRALALGEAGVGMAQALVAAGSPAGVRDNAGATAMALAAGSREATIRALLPAMVRRECDHYQQLQRSTQGPQHQQQEQQRQLQEEENEGKGGQQPGLAAVLAAVVEGVSALVSATAATGLGWDPEPVAQCFRAVMEVLGPAVGGGLLQLVLERVAGVPPTPMSGFSGSYVSVTLVLYRVLHRAWLADLQPLLQQRGTVHRLQRLVTQPLHSEPARTRQQQCQPRRQVVTSSVWVSSRSAALKAEASAAAAAGQWQVWVHLLEQLAGLHPPSGEHVIDKVVRVLLGARATPPHMTGLCEALLGAWVAARQDLGRRKQRELADAVVAAVGVWQQQTQAVEPEGGRRKRQRAGRAPGR
jgi:ankyrin repeat protein